MGEGRRRAATLSISVECWAGNEGRRLGGISQVLSLDKLENVNTETGKGYTTPKRPGNILFITVAPENFG